MRFKASRRGRSVWIRYYLDEAEAKVLLMGCPGAVGLEYTYRYTYGDEEKAREGLRLLKGSGALNVIPGIASTDPRTQEAVRELYGKIGMSLGRKEESP